MTDFSSPASIALPLFVGAHGQFGALPTANAISNNTGASAVRTWTAKLISYAPVWLPFPYPVNRVFWANGSTNTTTNVDFGVYTWDGTRIYNTGSTAMGTVSTIQYVTPGTTFVLAPGPYYFAWTCDNTTSRGYSMSGTANASRLAGLLQETTAGFGLPATMTPVAFAQAWGPSVCGVTRTTTGF